MTEYQKSLPYRPCVGLMIVNRHGQVLIAKRIDNEAGESWQMPQGGIEAGESAQEAALRELKEETGIERKNIEFITETKHWLSYDLPLEWVGKVLEGYRGQKQKWFFLTFLGQDKDINIETEEPEFSEWKWIHPTELLNIVIPFKQEVYRMLLIEFNDVLNRK